jgi:predicted TIM-barrel fold metal-dependent hydrolase
MDVSALDAIDVHTYVHRSVTAATPEDGQALEAMAAYFKTDAAAYTVDELAQYYRARNMAAVTFTVDVKDRPARVSSEEIAERAAANADMPIILAHPSFPWQEEALAVAMHKPQVYIDLSGWSPKYFPPVLVQYANTLLKDKVLFGTDFPMLTPERWRGDLEQTAIRDEIKPALYKHNAARLLGL